MAAFPFRQLFNPHPTLTERGERDGAIECDRARQKKPVDPNNAHNRKLIWFSTRNSANAPMTPVHTEHSAVPIERFKIGD